LGCRSLLAGEKKASLASKLLQFAPDLNTRNPTCRSLLAGETKRSEQTNS
jgi:hypothetical protein